MRGYKCRRCRPPKNRQILLATSSGRPPRGGEMKRRNSRVVAAPPPRSCSCSGSDSEGEMPSHMPPYTPYKKQIHSRRTSVQVRYRCQNDLTFPPVSPRGLAG